MNSLGEWERECCGMWILKTPGLGDFVGGSDNKAEVKVFVKRGVTFLEK